jgi:predicted dehydrogenase
MADVVRVGIVGMGGRGHNWIRTMQLVERARIVAVADHVESYRAAGATQAGLDAHDAHVEAAELIARSDVDAVVVAVATEHQPDLVVQALEAGKHVACEVPLAYSLEDCWRIVLAAERSGCKLSYGSQRNYSPFVQAWRKLLADGLLGKILYGECQYIHGFPVESTYWRDRVTGRSLTWTEARENPNAQQTRFWNISHPIKYATPALGPILHTLDDRIVRATGVSTRRPSYYLEEVPIPDLEVALLETAGGAIIRLACGFIVQTPRPHHWWHLLGTLGEVETGRRSTPEGTPDGDLFWLADHYMLGRQEVKWSHTAFQPGLARARGSGHSGLDYYPAHELVHSILEDRQPGVDVYRAAETDGAAIVAAQSIEQGGVPLPVPDFRPGPHRAPGQVP